MDVLNTHVMPSTLAPGILIRTSITIIQVVAIVIERYSYRWRYIKPSLLVMVLTMAQQGMETTLSFMLKLPYGVTGGIHYATGIPIAQNSSIRMLNLALGFLNIQDIKPTMKNLTWYFSMIH